MEKAELLAVINANFLHAPTPSQTGAMNVLSDFLMDRSPACTMVLNGYAGTGKTTLISAIVKTMHHYNRQPVLMAPTGRAAKVMSLSSGYAASTIHKKIYWPAGMEGGGFIYRLAPSKIRSTLFIVDEASMIGEFNPETGNSLLDDLIRYVFQAEKCKLILVGDIAQLPPVGLSDSPALNEEYLKNNFSLNLYYSSLTDVVRQKSDSGILHNATRLRISLYSEDYSFPKFETAGFPDIKPVSGVDLPDVLQKCYDTDGVEDTLVVCRSNKSAVQYNNVIRNRILWNESQVSGGDYLMVVKNNYTWLSPDSKAGFIANGDIFFVKKIRSTKEMYGFTFAEATITFIDYPDEPETDVMLLLDTLTSETAGLSHEQHRKLYEEIMQDYTDEPNKQKRKQLIKQNPYYNALHVKFAYALTCHKSQGGQWKNVFVDHGYLTEEMINADFLRWIYTAFTRATTNLYLVNFKNEMLDTDVN